LESQLSSLPKPIFRLTPVGTANKLLFIPEENPRLVAWHIAWLTYLGEIQSYHHQLNDWLSAQNYKVDTRPLLSHVSVARLPFEKKEWEIITAPFPVTMKAVHLYESVGNLNYEPLWSHHLLPAYTEIPHTADIAFHIQGTDLFQIYVHAIQALAHKYPPLLPFVTFEKCISLDELIIALNALIARVDAAIGIPFKAVSFHGELKQNPNAFLEWEMIVDV